VSAQPSKPLVWRQITPFEWLGYQGAERWPNGAAPLIADLEVDGFAAQAILDPEGLSIFWDVDGVQQFAGASEHPAFIVAQLQQAETLDQLRALGCGRATL
jgi:hypothetical protein